MDGVTETALWGQAVQRQHYAEHTPYLPPTIAHTSGTPVSTYGGITGPNVNDNRFHSVDSMTQSPIQRDGRYRHDHTNSYRLADGSWWSNSAAREQRFTESTSLRAQSHYQTAAPTSHWIGAAQYENHGPTTIHPSPPNNYSTPLTGHATLTPLTYSPHATPHSTTQAGYRNHFVSPSSVPLSTQAGNDMAYHGPPLTQAALPATYHLPVVRSPSHGAGNDMAHRGSPPTQTVLSATYHPPHVRSPSHGAGNDMAHHGSSRTQKALPASYHPSSAGSPSHGTGITTTPPQGHSPPHMDQYKTY